jgi:hypothetical protein
MRRWTLGFAEAFLASCVVLAAPQTQNRTVAEPSLGEVARQTRAKEAREHLADVPLFTNDNLPTSESLGVVGSSVARGQQAATGRAARESSVERKKLEALQYDLSQAQQRLELHQREFTVLQKELSQNNIQYYPNPNQTLLQEYSREGINRLTDEISRKKQEIAEDQQTVSNLQGELQIAYASFGWLRTGLGPPTPPPIAAKPGSPAYWRAELARARKQLASAKEQAKVAENELQLLSIQRVRTLNPDIQASLASAISAKAAEISTIQRAVEEAHHRLLDVEQAMKAKGIPQEGGS